MFLNRNPSYQIELLLNHLLSSLIIASILALGIEAKSPERSDEYYNKLNVSFIA